MYGQEQFNICLYTTHHRVQIRNCSNIRKQVQPYERSQFPAGTVPVQARWIFTFQAAPPWCILKSLKSGKEFLHLLY